MSVFTSVSIQELQIWLQDYAIGELVDLKGISAGITNTNYFVTTKNDNGIQSKYVLTLFEQNAIEDLPYFIDLMSHFAAVSYTHLDVYKRQSLHQLRPTTVHLV